MALVAHLREKVPSLFHMNKLLRIKVLLAIVLLLFFLECSLPADAADVVQKNETLTEELSPSLGQQEPQPSTVNLPDDNSNQLSDAPAISSTENATATTDTKAVTTDSVEEEIRCVFDPDWDYDKKCTWAKECASRGSHIPYLKICFCYCKSKYLYALFLPFVFILLFWHSALVSGQLPSYNACM